MKTKSEVWNFIPADDVKSLMKKAVNSAKRKGLKGRKTGKGDGLRTMIIMEALRAYCASFRGKREGNISA